MEARTTAVEPSRARKRSRPSPLTTAEVALEGEADVVNAEGVRVVQPLPSDDEAWWTKQFAPRPQEFLGAHASGPALPDAEEKEAGPAPTPRGQLDRETGLDLRTDSSAATRRGRSGSISSEAGVERLRSTHANPFAQSEAPRFRYACVSRAKHRVSSSANEDKFSVIANLIDPTVRSGVSLYCVFDGHGGDQVSEFAAAHLWQLVREGLLAIENLGDLWAPDQAHPHLCVQSLGGAGSACGKCSTVHWAVAAMLQHAIEGVHARFLAMADPSPSSKRLKQEDLEAQPSPSGGGASSVQRSIVCGSTVTALVVLGNWLFTAWLGDSLAVLVRGDHTLVSLTPTPHVATDPSERARVTEAGGEVRGDRVAGVLQVTRAIGSTVAIGKGISPTPDVSWTNIQSSDSSVILATDGLWDVLPDDAIAQVLSLSPVGAVHSPLADPPSVTRVNCRVSAERLVAEALRRGTRDDVTVMVIDLLSRPVIASPVTST
jgi:serine/threonine protein phosphatase PrpC